MAGRGMHVNIGKSQNTYFADEMTIGSDGTFMNGRRFNHEREQTPTSNSSLTTDSSLGEDQASDFPTPTPVAEAYQPQPSDDYVPATDGQNSLRADGLDQGACNPTDMEELKPTDNRRSPDDHSLQHPQRNSSTDSTELKVLAADEHQAATAQGGPSLSDPQLGVSFADSITMDGGGNSLSGNSLVVSSLSGGGTQTIYAFSHNARLVHNSDHDVFVISTKSNEDVLQTAALSGCFDDGLTPLLQMDWTGLHLTWTKWKLTLNSGVFGSSRLKDLTKELCETLRTWDSCARKMVEHLHQAHAAFLCSLSWDGGLVIFLGHDDERKRPEFLQTPVKQQVQTVLLELLPDCCLDLFTWEEPAIYDEEEKEDGGQSPILEVKSAISSSSSGDGSSFSRSLSEAFPKGQQLPSNSGFLDRASSRESNSSGSDLNLFLDRVIEDKVLGCLASKQEPQEKVQEKMSAIEVKLANQMKMTESLTQKQMQVEKQQRMHTSKMAETDETLQKKLDDVQRNYESRIAEMSKKFERDKQELKKEVAQSKQRLEIANLSGKRHSSKVSEEVSKTCEEYRKAVREEVEQDIQRHSVNLQGQVEELTKKLQEEKANFQSAQEGLKLWCARFEQKGHRALEVALQQLRETDLQRRELHAQKDKQLALMLERFTHKVATRIHEHARYTEERLKTFQAQILQESMLQQTRQQDSLLEVHKLRKEMQDYFKNLPGDSGPGSGHVGMVLASEPEGAVGNEFSKALSESETMSKMKGKDEELTSNEFEDKMRLPYMPEISGELAGKRSSAAAQNGMKSKAMQPDRQKADSDKGSGSESPPTERKQVAQNRSESPPSSAEGNQDDDDMAKAEEFLDWINIRGNLNGSQEMARTISKHVKAALKEEEVRAPRAKCLDTILCLDVSDSIVNAGHLETVKKTASDFVDGVEDLMVEMDLEENIAVVALGGHARVLQHLTNDLTLVREAIDSVDNSGGRSPFMQALLVCLAANKGRGGIVSISGVYKVRPRIIFITDGCPTDESQETGPDLQSNQNQTNFCIVQLLSQLASKKHRSTPRPIHWVPVGQANEDFLKSMAGLSGGDLVLPENVRSLCRYYKVQQTIGRIFKMVKNKDSNIVQEDKIRELMKALESTLDPVEQDFIVKEVMQLQKAPVEEEELEADDFDNVFEDEEKVKNGELLCLGTRVKRGPDWKWKNQDTEGFGTVVQHSKQNNWIYVKWDNGTCNAYRYGQEGCVDVEEIQHNPRLVPPDSERLDFGVRVVRGPDWKWENQDGKGPGTVIRVRGSDDKVKVRWDKTSKVLKYQYDALVKEVQILLPEFPRCNSDDSSPQNEQQEHDTDKTIAIWQWRDEQRQWRLYESDINDKLEAEYLKRPNASCVVRRDGKSRRVSFKHWQDKAVDSGSATEVRREMVDEERKNDLLAIELSLQYS